MKVQLVNQSSPCPAYRQLALLPRQLTADNLSASEKINCWGQRSRGQTCYHDIEIKNKKPKTDSVFLAKKTSVATISCGEEKLS